MARGWTFKREILRRGKKKERRIFRKFVLRETPYRLPPPDSAHLHVSGGIMLSHDLAPYYLASPYSRHPRGHVGAYLEACRLTAQLFRRYGVVIFSPIMHSHGLSMHGGFPLTDHAFWLRYDAPFVSQHKALLVAKMDGWEESFGVAHEVATFRSAQKPILFVDVETLELAVA